ncbi:hypothetical protein B7Z28_01140 [Candidatus Saccharibacteria bacterium 32-45-3]|nr:MAG: hypothetical protein B7Z28_01140 [Candidatus Saccharibacteria bacterium 32-45-3]
MKSPLSSSKDTSKSAPKNSFWARFDLRDSKAVTRIVTYVAILTMIVSLGAFGNTEDSAQGTLDANFSRTAVQVDRPSVDQMLAADLAARTAAIADFSIASNASNLSITLNAKNQYTQASTEIIVKPQIFQANDARGLRTYTTKVGDTVPAVARDHGVSVDTVKWANNLTTDALGPDQLLTIPVVDGVVYTLKEGDSADSIATRYGGDASRIISYNDLEFGITPGAKIVIPSGVLPETERPGYSAPRLQTAPQVARTTTSSGVTTAVIAGNRYDYGYCTWYVYNRRAELGRPIGSFWGNASSWAYMAGANGYLVNRTPEIGAIMQDSYSAGGYGHVAVVESMTADGGITVSEMNYNGWGVKSYRTLSAGQASGYNYIH